MVDKIQKRRGKADMLQLIGQGSASDVSTAAVVPCTSPSMSLVFDEFTYITPLVKEELRFAIQSKRISNGEPNVEFGTGTESSSDAVERRLTPREDERRCRRRERNKIAAAKCRNKKKERTDILQKYLILLRSHMEHNHNLVCTMSRSLKNWNL
ncbi:cyclic AMP-dependent transcription factor ATF-3 isoform X3 [Rhinoraja longicauda]